MKEELKKPYCNAPYCNHSVNSYCRWEHNCIDYKQGTLNFCSACEYYYETKPLTLWKKIINFFPLYGKKGGRPKKT